MAGVLHIVPVVKGHEIPQAPAGEVLGRPQNAERKEPRGPGVDKSRRD